MHNRVVVLSLAVAISTALAIGGSRARARAPERQLVTRAADALGGRDRVMARQDAADRRLRRTGVLQRRREHHRRSSSPAEVAEGARLHTHDRSRALAHARAAAPEDGLRLRIDGRAARAQSDQRDAGRRCRLQHRRRIPGGPSDGNAAATARRARRRPPASRGAARPSGHDRARRARCRPASCRTSGNRATCSSSTSPCVRATR